jgi:enoyl-CoA hydratase/carnithine racemase
MSAVTTHDEGRVRYIVFNRPDKMNALNMDLAWGYLAALNEAAKDDDVWVIGVTGSGRAFCAGLDLTGSNDSNPDPQPALTRQLDDLGWVSRLLLDARACDKPIVAGINGVAVGAGLSLAMGADIRIIKRGARLMAGYPRIGGSPDGGLSYTLPQAMNYEQGLRFLLENRTVEGDEAVRLGLAGEVVDDDRFEERFKEYCQSLTKLSPITARLSKRVVKRATATVDLEGQLRYELVNIRMAFGSEDGKEARQAFLERRDPVFKGK